MTHARSGGNIEVMGMLVGKVKGECMIVMDVFPLPVEGTETRVNAHEAANEYMVAHTVHLQTVRADAHYWLVRGILTPNARRLLDLSL